MVLMHVWFNGLRRHDGEIAGENLVRPLCSFKGFSVQSELQGAVFGVLSYDIY